jgi:alpha-tubulin suppressor-like RCC1 family protein
LGISKNATAVSSGWVSACALLLDGTIQCWGQNQLGELGNGTVTYNSLVPVTVVGITNANAIAAGYYQTCAVLAGGTVQCWGYNAEGQLGNGTTTNSSVPITVPGITADSVVLGDACQQTCALLTDGTVQCWGDNSQGELGNGTTTNSAVPVTVVGITNVAAVVAGQCHACALITGGTIQCWGDNRAGELGNGTTTNSSVPVTVLGF